MKLYFAILFLPIFLFGMLVLTSYQLIDFYSKTQKLCRSHILLAQKQVGQHLEKLINLNKKAASLRAEEKKLKATIASLAAIPPATVPFIKLLKINHFRQSLLRGRQELLLTKAKTIASGTLQKLKLALAPNIATRNTPVQIKVKRSPSTAIAPSFHPVPNFESRQTISIRWRAQLTNTLVTPLLNYFKTKSIMIEGKCAATLVAKGTAWNPKLKTARF